ncbi:MAG: hypothetical protein COB43_04950 [Oceanospirillales bacterium]|nr:MAG: hypothetical protein COB43_04950 [Oceanospirillales bacterium]
MYFSIMTQIVDRFIELWKLERLTAKWLAEETGVEEKRWYNIKQNKVMRTSELEAIQKIFPEYRSWLSTGDEYLEAGQISPMTKKAQRS